MDDIANTAPLEPYDELGDLYDEWCAGVVEDVPFYTGLAAALASERGGPLTIVELGAGSGRITLPLAAAGHTIKAIDLSQVQLARLDARARQAGLTGRVATVTADMRELDRLVDPGSCDLVIAPFRGLLHVTADRDRLFAAVRRALAERGAFAFDVFHPGPEAAAAMTGDWQLRRRTRTEGGRWRFDERAILIDLGPEPAATRTSSQRTRIELDVRCTFEPARPRPARRRRGDRDVAEPGPGDPTVRITRMLLEAVPTYAWLDSIERSGLVLDGAYGWFDGRPLAADDDDSAWVARAPAD